MSSLLSSLSRADSGSFLRARVFIGRISSAVFSSSVFSSAVFSSAVFSLAVARFFRQGTRFMYAALVMAFVVVSSASHATVVVLDDLATMVHRADVIAHVQVLSQQTLHEKGRIVTLSKFEVLDGVKGASQGEVLTVYQVGGSLDGEQLFIGGAHRHQVGEELVFFAMHHGERVVSYGVGTGSFKVDRGSVFGSVQEDLDDLQVVNLQGELQKDAARQAPSVVEFKAQLRDLLQTSQQFPTAKSSPDVLKSKRAKHSGVVQVKGGRTLRDLRMHGMPKRRLAPQAPLSIRQGGE